MTAHRASLAAGLPRLAGAAREDAHTRMNLLVLVAMVVVGVSAIVLAVHMTGGSVRANIADAEAARLRFAVDHPDAGVERVVLTADRGTAFLAIEGGMLGLVEAVGDRFLTRMLGAGDILSMVRRDEVTMDITAGDFTWRGGQYRFDAAAEADAVAAMIDETRREERA